MKLAPAELIRKKRDGGHLSPDELSDFVLEYARDRIPDYQMAAFLMAVFFRGMDEAEMVSLVRSMRNSGTPLDLADIPGFKIDKHSTGGVGDKISLILAPLWASLGLTVPMISGRGLGHSGGTLDKLESVPGLQTRIPVERFKQILAEVGFVIAGQTEQMVPADKKMYALRDATATVESVPLVVGSILSKKLSEDLDALVLDVKTGKGAFFRSQEKATELARALLMVSREFGVPARALLTSMEQPIGWAVGNWVEVVESVECLQGNCPEDTWRLVEELTVLALELSGVRESRAELLRAQRENVASGEAMERFLKYVHAMGGDVRAVEQPERFALPEPVVFASPASGFVAELDAFHVGMAAFYAGAGRKKMSDPVDPAAGIRVLKKVGDSVTEGEPLALVYSRTTDTELIEREMRAAYRIAEKPAEPLPMVFGEVEV